MNEGPIVPIILGPTASGKTRLAVHVANALNGEILSADSRQVYRGMDLGTGKDLAEYQIGETRIPVHGLDLLEPSDEFSVFQFQSLFVEVFSACDRVKNPLIVCGGTGFYLSSLLTGKRLVEVPKNPEFWKACEDRTDEALERELRQLKSLHNATDLHPRERLVRALEIARFEQHLVPEDLPRFTPLLIGIAWDPLILRERILKRLQERIAQGMIDEITALRSKGISDERLDRFGLEYRYGVTYLRGEMTQDDMIATLHWAICDFAKRQRTWFRKMERQGHQIHWIPGEWAIETQTQEVLRIYQE